MSSSMKCSSCGAVLREGTRFCGKCGSPVQQRGPHSSKDREPAKTVGTEPLPKWSAEEVQQESNQKGRETSSNSRDLLKDKDIPWAEEGTVKETVSDRSWHYTIGDKKIGPVPEFFLHDLFQQRDLNGETMLWNPGLSRWKSARELGFVKEKEKTCPGCKTVLSPKAKFCKSCGAPVKKMVDEKPQGETESSTSKPLVCLQCGNTRISDGAVFCSRCGSSLNR